MLYEVITCLSSSIPDEGDPMATTTNIVNLDALITRADLAAPGESSEDITALSVPGLEKRVFFTPPFVNRISSGKPLAGVLNRSRT